MGISSPNHRLQEKQIQDRVPPRSSAEATVSQNWGWESGGSRGALTQSSLSLSIAEKIAGCFGAFLL